MISYDFRIKTKVVDPAFSVQMMGIWLKTKLQVMDMYPNASNTPYARELEIYGMKPIWVDDWMGQLNSMPSTDRTVIELCTHIKLNILTHYNTDYRLVFNKNWALF